MLASPRCVKVIGMTILGGIILPGCGGGTMPTSAPVTTPPILGMCTPAPLSTLRVNVKDSAYGAKGDGITDDSAAIQKAVNAVAGTGGTVTIPAGTYRVNPVVNTNAGIRLGSNMTLSLEAGAVLQALPTTTSRYVVVLLSGVQNVNIRGGLVLGNRYNNTITDADEAGFGVQVMNSTHVVVEGMTAKDCWADGFYVGASSQDVTLCQVVADNNRRNGMSITSVKGMAVRGCTFKNATGSIENGSWVNGFGIDIEPNVGETVAEVHISGCTFAANANAGLAVGPSGANAGRAFVTNTLIDGNTATGNGLRGGGSGIGISNTSGHQITNNTITDNIGTGICLRNEANANLVRGNTVTGTKAAPSPGDIGYGILLYLTGGNTVTGNTVTNSAACGIRDAYPSGTNSIGSNILSNNHPDTCP